MDRDAHEGRDAGVGRNAQGGGEAIEDRDAAEGRDTAEGRDSGSGEAADVAIVGAGAAGLMAAIWAGRSRRGGRIVLLDGAEKLGAKILIAGGGRCNVTHDRVEESAFAGSSRAAIRKVLLRLDVPHTVRFFREIGVELKREATGKLFPATDSARSVLEALLRAARSADVEIRHPWRVSGIRAGEGGFEIAGAARERGGFAQAGVAGTPASPSAAHAGCAKAASSPSAVTLRARRVVLATGGRSVPKTGSDGRGYEIARSLGHTVTRTLPGLVPLLLAEGSFLRALSGVSTEATLEVRSASGKKLASFTGPVLCTHFGLSGPAALDVSRYYLAAAQEDPTARLLACWAPAETRETMDAALRDLGAAGPARFLSSRMPHRLARALCVSAGVDPAAPGHSVTREARRALVEAVVEMRLPVTGSRGFDYAEVTAGGVPLSEVRLETMESRVCPGLFLCGEICDVDGRVGGYNFQWAWASGHVAGISASGDHRSS